MMTKQQNIFFSIVALSTLFFFFLGEMCFAFLDEEETQGASRLTRRSPVKKRRPPLREAMKEIVKDGASEYALVSAAKLPGEEGLTLEEEESFLAQGFDSPRAFLSLFNFYRRSLITQPGCLGISSVMEEPHPSFNILFKEDEEIPEKILIEMFFIPSILEAECQKVAMLNPRLRSISVLFKNSLENPKDQIFWKIFFRTFDGILENKMEMEEGMVQVYANLQSGDDIWKIIVRDVKSQKALYFRYHPETLK